MANNSYQPATYREQGGNRFVVASSGSLDVESGGEIDVEAGGRLEIGGTPFITSGGLIDLSSAVSKTTGVYSSGTGTFDAVTTTGGTVGSGKFNSVTSTGTGTFNAVTSTGTGTFNAVTSTGAVTGDSFTSTGGTAGSGKFNSVTSTGTGTFNAVTSTGTVTADAVTTTGGTDGSGKFNSVTSTGTGTFNAVTSTGVITGDAFTSTGGTDGSGKFNSVTSTGTGTFNAVTSTGTGSFSGYLSALGGFKHYLESATSSWTAITNIFGVTVIKSTADSEQLYALSAPSSGVEKWLICNNVLKSSGVSTGAAIVTSSGAGAAFGGYTSILFTTGATVNQWVHLIGLNSTQWLMAGASTDVTFSTT